MKIQVIGNCQARPLADLLQDAGHDTLPSIIVHLARVEEHDAHRAALDAADLILTQRTEPTYPVPHLRSAELRAAYGDKVLVWPNIFYAGEQPYLRYATHARLGRLPSPLADYHDLRLLRDWFADRKGIAFGTAGLTPEALAAYAAQSLSTLRAREADCDVQIADLIAAGNGNGNGAAPLFFTFNHPRLSLLAELARRLMARAGVPVEIDIAGRREPLGRIQPPRSGALEDEAPFQGVEVRTEPDGRIAMGAVRPYSAAELRQAFYACYDHIAAEMLPAALRLTPAAAPTGPARPGPR